MFVRHLDRCYYLYKPTVRLSVGCTGSAPVVGSSELNFLFMPDLLDLYRLEECSSSILLYSVYVCARPATNNNVLTTFYRLTYLPAYWCTNLVLQLLYLYFISFCWWAAAATHRWIVASELPLPYRWFTTARRRIDWMSERAWIGWGHCIYWLLKRSIGWF